MFLAPKVCHGCDESPCLSCGELVSDSPLLIGGNGNTFVLYFNVCRHSMVPVRKWLNLFCHCSRSYNVTCTEELARPGFPKTCCTIQDIPLIRSAVLAFLFFLYAVYKSNCVSAKAPRHELAPCYVVALLQSLTHSLPKLLVYSSN